MNEELQSTNDELHSINDTLRERSVELDERIAFWRFSGQLDPLRDDRRGPRIAGGFVERAARNCGAAPEGQTAPP